MKSHELIETLKQKSFRDVALHEVTAVVGLLARGELLHINGKAIQALDNLANNGVAIYNDATITRDGGDWVVCRDNYMRREEEALQAVFAAERGPMAFGHLLPGWYSIYFQAAE